ncbi:MAG TPA: hypothetical protein PKY81_12850 [bacterium]|nr:hypothetical protein [bacterium]HPN31835.1 hypothetical protein [bacterium]
MNEFEYYKYVIDKLESNFRFSRYVVGAGKELIKRGWNPNGLLVSVEPKNNIRNLACNYCLQTHIPIVGINSEYILAPIDFEISLTDQNYKLYESKQAQTYYFKAMVTPLLNYLEEFFISRKIPFLLDLTPSGGHILFWVKKGTNAWESFKKIGYLEPDLMKAYEYKDPNDIKRITGVSEEAGLVFSGIGRISEYIGLKSKVDLNGKTEYPISFCDSLMQSLNFDISWASDAAYMRSIRSPFSLHKKNREKYYNLKQSSLVDVIRIEFDGKKILPSAGFMDIDYQLDCMWDLWMAAKHSKTVSGLIPVADDSVCGLIDEYMNSDLYAYHRKFDYEPILPKGKAMELIKSNHKLNQHARYMLDFPEPYMLQPMQLNIFIRELVSNHNYSPKTVGCLIRDYYQDSRWKWYGTDWYKYPSETRAFFWTRLYSDELFTDNKIINL